MRNVRSAIQSGIVCLAGIALAVYGWRQLLAEAYVIGLILALGGAFFVVADLEYRSTRRRVVVTGCTAVVYLAVFAGAIWAPKHAVLAEYDGSHGGWSVAAPTGRETRLPVRVGHDVTVATPGSVRLVSLRDGHRIATIASTTALSDAAGSLLTQTARPGAPSTYALYDQAGRRRWSGIKADTALAARGDVVVLRSCTVAACVLRGYEPTGAVGWSDRFGAFDVAAGVIASDQQLPSSGLGTDELPGSAVVRSGRPSDTSVAAVVDATTGSLQTIVTGVQTGVLEGAAVSVVRRGEACTAISHSFDGGRSRHADLGSCAVDDLNLLGSLLVLSNPEHTRVLDLAAFAAGRGARIRDCPFALNLASPATAPYDLARAHDTGAVTPLGWTRVQGRSVTGGAWSAPKPWRYRSDAPAVVYAGDGTAVVLNVAQRSNALDPAPGYDAAGATAGSDVQVTVLDLRTGRVTGRLRTHGPVEALRPLGSGSAVVVTDGRLLLLGRSLR